MLKMIYICSKCNKKFEREKNDDNPLNECEMTFFSHRSVFELCEECTKIYELRIKTFEKEMNKEFNLYNE